MVIVKLFGQKSSQKKTMIELNLLIELSKSSAYPLHQVKEVKHGVDRVFYISSLLIINQLK